VNYEIKRKYIRMKVRSREVQNSDDLHTRGTHCESGQIIGVNFHLIPKGTHHSHTENQRFANCVAQPIYISGNSPELASLVQTSPYQQLQFPLYITKKQYFFFLFVFPILSFCLFLLFISDREGGHHRLYRATTL